MKRDGDGVGSGGHFRVRGVSCKAASSLAWIEEGGLVLIANHKQRVCSLRMNELADKTLSGAGGGGGQTVVCPVKAHWQRHSVRLQALTGSGPTGRNFG